MTKTDKQSLIEQFSQMLDGLSDEFAVDLNIHFGFQEFDDPQVTGRIIREPTRDRKITISIGDLSRSGPVMFDH